LGLVILHVFFLHQHGGSNPLNLDRHYNLIPFHWYFTRKDLIYIIYWLIFYFTIVILFPFLLGDSENFILANPIVTPPHIVPEWYFLFAYAVLRRIPNKLFGVIILIISILILFIPPFIKIIKKGINFQPISQFIFWIFVGNFVLLTWLGGNVVEQPFIILREYVVLFYFLNFGFYLILNYIESKIYF
jgi:ubiquinol-cytochrome c reductase cytochrome b subunit